jgi:hypothetical protein
MHENPFIEEPTYFDNKIRGMWFSGQGRVFNTHGDNGGIQGIWNAQGQVQGIYDAPKKTVWKSGAFQEGSTQKAVKSLERDMTLGFHCIETDTRTAEANESDFRMMFEYEVDEWDDDPEPTIMHIETDQSGERRLDLLMYDTPTMESDTDPIEGQYFNLILKVRAGQPNWYELDPITGAAHKTVFEDSATSAEGYIEVENPTDTEMRHEWVLTRATWNVPDPSWRGGRGKRRPAGQYGSRVVTLKPITAIQGGIRISLDGSKLHVRDFNYTNAIGAIMPAGKRIIHRIPPYTPKTRLPISYTAAPPGGARAELIQPRRWTRPWGQEL